MNIGSPSEDNKVTDPKVHQLLQFFSRVAPEAQRVFKILISRGMPVKEAATAALEGAVQKELEKGRAAAGIGATDLCPRPVRDQVIKMIMKILP